MRHLVQDIVERYLDGRGKRSGESNIMYSCPFHTDASPSFSVNVDLGLFNCFSCKRHGNIIKLLKMLQVPDRVIDEETKGIRDELEANKHRLLWKRRRDYIIKDPFLAETILPETMLRPYLYAPTVNGESVRALPTKLMNDGFDYRILDQMEVGFDRRLQRITYPIRDLYGNLAGIAGGSTLAGQYPKYKVYEGRRKDPQTNRVIPSDFGEWFDEKYPDYVFHNHNYLWNFDAVYPSLFFGKDPNAFVVIVEGYKACLWLLQVGYSNTIALMGSSMSERQSSLLHRLRANVVLFLDNDEPGRKGMFDIGKQLHKYQPGVFIAHYPYAEECQPDWLSPAEVTAAIQGSITFPQWTRGVSAS